MVNPFDPKSVLLAKHAQHVVLIHFPIALFIAAEGFDLIAQWTKRRGLADAAYYNLLVAAVSTLPVLATGILAWQFQLEGQKLKGILQRVCARGRRADMNEHRATRSSRRLLRRRLKNPAPHGELLSARTT